MKSTSSVRTSVCPTLAACWATETTRRSFTEYGRIVSGQGLITQRSGARLPFIVRRQHQSETRASSSRAPLLNIGRWSVPKQIRSYDDRFIPDLYAATKEDARQREADRLFVRALALAILAGDHRPAGEPPVLNLIG